MRSTPPRPADDPGATACATRRRLVEAAGEVFADRGLRAATVREICRRAGANVAAVNYHFGGKDELYATILHEATREALAQYPPLLSTGPSDPPEERLHAFVHSLLLRILDEGRPAWLGKLMMREMAEPTPALGGFVARSIRPLFELLGGIVGELLARGNPRRRVPRSLVERCVASVLGQCLFYKHTKPVTQILVPGQRFDRAAIAGLAAHVTRFSLAAIDVLSHEEPRAARRRR